MLIGLIVAMALAASSQSQLADNFLVKHFEGRIAYDHLQEFSTAVLDYVEKQNSRGKTKVAIRLCTNRSFKSASRKSVISLKALYGVFHGYGFIGKDLLLLTSSDCHMGRSIVPMEIWIINDSNKLPPYREIYNSAEIR